MSSEKDYQQLIYYVLSSFTKDGTPLSALVGNKLEWQVTTIMAGLLANPGVVEKLDPIQIADAAINYANIIQERLGHYQNAQIHTLEKLIDQ